MAYEPMNLAGIYMQAQAMKRARADEKAREEEMAARKRQAIQDAEHRAGVNSAWQSAIGGDLRELMRVAPQQAFELTQLQKEGLSAQAAAAAKEDAARQDMLAKKARFWTRRMDADPNAYADMGFAIKQELGPLGVRWEETGDPVKDSARAKIAMEEFASGRLAPQENDGDALAVQRKWEWFKGLPEEEKKAVREAGMLSGGVNVYTGEKVPANVAIDIGEFKVVPKLLDNLLAKFEAAVPSDTLFERGASWAKAATLTNSPEALYDNSVVAVNQVMGRLLEGGVLKEPEFVRYKAMLPKPGDSRDAARLKIENLKEILDLKLKSATGALGEYGFRSPKTSAAAPVQAKDLMRRLLKTKRAKTPEEAAQMARELLEEDLP